MQILLVEDEIEFAKLTLEYLESEGITCDHSATGATALNLIAENDYDVILLDVNLPDMNGFSVCSRYRAQGFNTPTIMLTARSSIDDKSQGFDAGVDDYLVKPFAMAELVMRLHALSQRGKRSAIIEVGVLCLNAVEKQAFIAKDSEYYKLSLTPDEFRLLLLLAKREHETLSKTYIMDHLWPDQTVTQDALKMLISRLRKAIRHGLVENKQDENVIQVETIRGVGLKLVCQ